jgi:hypothetical protein
MAAATVMANLANRLASRSIDKLFDMLLVGSPASGGGILAGLFGGLPKFQSGGVVPGSGPLPIMAHGGEVVVPKAAVPRASSGASEPAQITYNIDARGAQEDGANQIVSALRNYDQQLNRSLPGRMAEMSARFG